MKRNESKAFLKAILSLETGERVALKRSLGQPLSQAKDDARMAFYKANPGEHNEQAAFICACAQCAMERLRSPRRNFVENLRTLAADSQSIGRRLTQLMGLPIDDDGYFAGKIGRLLRQMHQQDLNVDCARLLSDLCYWNHPNKAVQDKWARLFYANEKKEEPNDAD